MSNRQQRRQRRFVVEHDGNAHVLEGLGHVLVDGEQVDRLYRGVDLDAIPAGQHVWALFVMFAIDPARYVDSHDNGPAMLDTENMLQVTGPGCYRCEQTYTKAIAALPCPGEPG